jgi:hypothetical protein
MIMLRIVPKVLFFSCALIGLQACTPTAKQTSLSVASAYETSGTISVHPYTRTIFSTHNF